MLPAPSPSCAVRVAAIPPSQCSSATPARPGRRRASSTPTCGDLTPPQAPLTARFAYTNAQVPRHVIRRCHQVATRGSVQVATASCTDVRVRLTDWHWRKSREVERALRWRGGGPAPQPRCGCLGSRFPEIRTPTAPSRDPSRCLRPPGSVSATPSPGFGCEAPRSHCSAMGMGGQRRAMDHVLQ